jgi:lipopolysaccharide export system protein LptA
MVIRADRVEVRETPDGYRSGGGLGVRRAAGQLPPEARRRRRVRRRPADRIEFDGRAEVLRFVGNGVVRRLRGGDGADEITGALITWNHSAEQFSVQGGTPTPANPAAACARC